MARLFFIVFLALALGVTFTSRESFFGTAIHEEGDMAANALQIHRAKQLRELHGNYSRWAFHHPGPAFFYVYAAGEWLLHDLAGLAPAPYNAQIYSGVLLQLAFYAAAVALLARRSRQPWLLAGLAIAAGAWHFAEVPRAIFSVWPPDVLLMPFLCFVVAAAAVSVGDRGALPVLIVSGSFLVHGHVAQPLFVVPLAGLALSMAARGEWRGQLRAVLRSGPALVAAAGLALFLLPLAIDLFAGRKSNAHDILLHLRYQSDAGQSLWQAVLCYAGYFINLPDPSIFNQLSRESYAPFRAQAWVLAGWVLLLALAGWRLCRRGEEPGMAAELRFGRRLLLFWIGASVLTLVWGMRQDGGFTSFNSHFNHALVHLLLLIALVALTRDLPPVSRFFAGFVAVAASAWFIVNVHNEMEVGSRGDELEVRLQAVLDADPQPAAPKLLTFAAADWFEAVTLGRALQRRGIEFYVHPGFRFVFGNDRIFTNRNDSLSRGGVSVWHVLPHRNAPRHAHVLNREALVVFPTAWLPQPLPLAIDFGRDDQQRHLTFGIGRTEGAWAWTESGVAALLLQTAEADSDLELNFAASGLTTALAPQGQRVEVRVNGELLGKMVLGDEEKAIRLVVPREIWNRRSPRVILFDLPDALAPVEAGHSGDRRILGLRLHRLTVSPRGQNASASPQN